jgi:hypothetical protein
MMERIFQFQNHNVFYAMNPVQDALLILAIANLDITKINKFL